MKLPRRRVPGRPFVAPTPAGTAVGGRPGVSPLNGSTMHTAPTGSVTTPTSTARASASTTMRFVVSLVICVCLWLARFLIVSDPTVPLEALVAPLYCFFSLFLQVDELALLRASVLIDTVAFALLSGCLLDVRSLEVITTTTLILAVLQSNRLRLSVSLSVASCYLAYHAVWGRESPLGSNRHILWTLSCAFSTGLYLSFVVKSHMVFAGVRGHLHRHVYAITHAASATVRSIPPLRWLLNFIAFCALGFNRHFGVRWVFAAMTWTCIMAVEWLEHVSLGGVLMVSALSIGFGASIAGDRKTASVLSHAALVIIVWACDVVVYFVCPSWLLPFIANTVVTSYIVLFFMSPSSTLSAAHNADVGGIRGESEDLGVAGGLLKNVVVPAVLWCLLIAIDFQIQYKNRETTPSLPRLVLAINTVGYGLLMMVTSLVEAVNRDLRLKAARNQLIQDAIKQLAAHGALSRVFDSDPLVSPDGYREEEVRTGADVTASKEGSSGPYDGEPDSEAVTETPPSDAEDFDEELPPVADLAAHEAAALRAAPPIARTSGALRPAQPPAAAVSSFAQSESSEATESTTEPDKGHPEDDSFGAAGAAVSASTAGTPKARAPTVALPRGGAHHQAKGVTVLSLEKELQEHMRRQLQDDIDAQEAEEARRREKNRRQAEKKRMLQEQRLQDLVAQQERLRKEQEFREKLDAERRERERKAEEERLRRRIERERQESLAVAHAIEQQRIHHAAAVAAAQAPRRPPPPPVVDETTTRTMPALIPVAAAPPTGPSSRVTATPASSAPLVAKPASIDTARAAPPALPLPRTRAAAATSGAADPTDVFVPPRPVGSRNADIVDHHDIVPPRSTAARRSVTTDESGSVSSPPVRERAALPKTTPTARPGKPQTGASSASPAVVSTTQNGPAPFAAASPNGGREESLFSASGMESLLNLIHDREEGPKSYLSFDDFTSRFSQAWTDTKSPRLGSGRRTTSPPAPFKPSTTAQHVATAVVDELFDEDEDDLDDMLGDDDGESTVAALVTGTGSATQSPAKPGHQHASGEADDSQWNMIADQVTQMLDDTGAVRGPMSAAPQSASHAAMSQRHAAAAMMQLLSQGYPAATAAGILSPTTAGGYGGQLGGSLPSPAATSNAAADQMLFSPSMSQNTAAIVAAQQQQQYFMHTVNAAAGYYAAAAGGPSAAAASTGYYVVPQQYLQAAGGGAQQLYAVQTANGLAYVAFPAQAATAAGASGATYYVPSSQ